MRVYESSNSLDISNGSVNTTRLFRRGKDSEGKIHLLHSWIFYSFYSYIIFMYAKLKDMDWIQPLSAWGIYIYMQPGPSEIKCAISRNILCLPSWRGFHMWILLESNLKDRNNELRVRNEMLKCCLFACEIPADQSTLSLLICRGLTNGMCGIYYSTENLWRISPCRIASVVERKIHEMMEDRGRSSSAVLEKNLRDIYHAVEDIYIYLLQETIFMMNSQRNCSYSIDHSPSTY